MLGASTFAERAFSDQAILLAGASEMSGIASTASVGVGIMSGVASLDGNFTQTSNAIYISAGANADLDFNFTETSVGTRIQNDSSDIQSAFTKTAKGIMIGKGVASKDFSFTQESIGQLLFEEINASATPETFIAITPSGTDTWTEITPTGSETWTETETDI